MKTNCILLISLLAWGSAMGQISVTVYNQNMALVKEVREVEVEKGLSRLSYRDVAEQMDPTSVHFRSLTTPDRLFVLEQNFEYDLVGAVKILNKYIDHQIQVVLENGQVFNGVLLSSSGSHVVIRTSDGKIQVISASGIQHFDFPRLPEGLITRPTLIWNVQNEGPRKHNTELTYMTSGMTWHAEYVGLVNAEDSGMSIGGWVSIENHCGASFTDAKLKLVAGDVHRARRPRGDGFELEEARITARAAPQPFEEKAFFEYHLYTLTRPATLKNNQTKQISLFPSADVPISKIFVYDGVRQGEKVQVFLEFVNSESQGLGLPLPRGKVRIYKEDQDAQREFIGEDWIDHTPRDEKVRLLMGNAFDLKGERKQTERKTITQRSFEESYEIQLRNHKDTNVTIQVVENLSGDWEIRESTYPYEKRDARTAVFHLPVPARKSITLAYRVLIRY